MHAIEALRIFQRVAELRSFAGAAAALDLPRATVSTAIAGLERELGTRLLQRTTRRVELTVDGQTCLARAADLLADLDELGTLFRGAGAAVSGRVRIDLPVGIARQMVIPRLPELLSAHPGLLLELSCTDRRVDLVAEGFDGVIRVGVLAESSLVARPLGEMAVHNLASHGYVAAHGLPATPAALGTHRLIRYASAFDRPDPGFEYVDPDDGQARCAPMPGTLTVNNSDAYYAACRAGLGIIQAPALGLREALARGELVEILPRWRAEPMPVHLLVPHRRHQPARLQRVIAWLVDVVSAGLAADRERPP